MYFGSDIMNLRFTNWYTQAFGAALGVIACIYSYLNGYMSTYSNMDTYFDSLGFSGIISSYFLLPLCILTLLLALIKSYTSDKSFLNVSLENFNTGIIISTVIIGFMGARIYFTIPAIFILFNLINNKKTNDTTITENKNIEHKESKEEFIKESKEIINLEIEAFVNENTVTFQRINELSLEVEDNCIDIEIKENLDEKELKILATKLEMAKELLSKNAQRDFIIELTGLTLKQLEALEEQFRK